MCRSLAEVGEDVTIYATNLDFPKGYLDVPLNQPITQDGYTIWYFPVQFSPYIVSWQLAKNTRKVVSIITEILDSF
jgi:hypothetical protein